MQPNPNFTDRLLLSPKSAKFRSKRLSTFFLFRDRLLSSLRNVHYQSFGLSSFSFLGRILSYSSNVQSRPFLPSMSLSFGSSNFILTVHFFNRSVRPSWTVHFEPRPFTLEVISTMHSTASVPTAFIYFTHNLSYMIQLYQFNPSNFYRPFQLQQQLSNFIDSF